MVTPKIPNPLKNEKSICSTESPVLLQSDLYELNTFLYKGFQKAINKRAVLTFQLMHSHLPWHKHYKGGFWKSILIDVWCLPVYRWRLWIPWFLHLGIQGFHCLSLPWALWSGVQCYRATIWGRVIGSNSSIHWVCVTAKCPVEILYLCIVTFTSLFLSKFSSFCLNSEKWKEGWNHIFHPIIWK